MTATHTLYRHLEAQGGSYWATKTMLLVHEAINEAVERFAAEVQTPLIASLDNQIARMQALEGTLDAALGRLDSTLETPNV